MCLWNKPGKQLEWKPQNTSLRDGWGFTWKHANSIPKETSTCMLSQVRSTFKAFVFDFKHGSDPLSDRKQKWTDRQGFQTVPYHGPLWIQSGVNSVFIRFLLKAFLFECVLGHHLLPVFFLPCSSHPHISKDKAFILHLIWGSLDDWVNNFHPYK